ncbi:MAG: Uma2 family endonuclease [Candidatus Ozemobacteraceae bacterium]
MTKAVTREKHYTYGEYCQWPEDERWELIDGIPYDMTPAPNRLHQMILGKLYTQFDQFLENKTCSVYIAPFDVRLPEGKELDDDVTTVVQPDLVVVCDSSKLDDKGCRGAPDLVIEILSPSTSAKDQIKKQFLYERHGVKEFWLVHPTDRLVTIYRLVGNTFQRPVFFDSSAKIPVGILPELLIDCSRVFPHEIKIVKESPRRYL